MVLDVRVQGEWDTGLEKDGEGKGSDWSGTSYHGRFLRPSGV